MKEGKKSISSLALVLLAAVLMTAGAVSAFAESTGYEWESSFNGKSIVSSFDSGEVAEAVSGLQPGDEVTFEVGYTNRYSGDTDWYLENKVLQTLEATKGTDAENGGYTYELVHIDRNGREETLFSNERVGGEAKPDGMEGLEQATNALDEWFFLETLGEGESGRVILRIGFEGETQANDYMDTEGELELRFAVEIPETGRIVRTGDSRMLYLWTAASILAGLLLLIMAVFSRRKDRAKGGAQ